MEEKLTVTKPQRNYALDLLRIISMLMIVCLHIFSHGNVMENTNSVWYYPLLCIRNCCIIAVNLYVLIYQQLFSCKSEIPPVEADTSLS